jgi:DNA-binding transcriptional LysR family regulator
LHQTIIGLLELDDIHWDWMNWRTWLSRNDIHLPAQHKGLQVNNYPMLIDAARNGQGIALGWRYLVDADIDNGALVKPVDVSIKTKLGYYLVWPDRSGLPSTVLAFRDWAKNALAEKGNSRRFRNR